MKAESGGREEGPHGNRGKSRRDEDRALPAERKIGDGRDREDAFARVADGGVDGRGVESGLTLEPRGLNQHERSGTCGPGHSEPCDPHNNQASLGGVLQAVIGNRELGKIPAGEEREDGENKKPRAPADEPVERWGLTLTEEPGPDRTDPPSDRA